MKNVSEFVTNKQLSVEVFDKSQCLVIHQAVLEVLKEVGVEVHNNGALELLKKAGAFVDGTRVRFPEAMVEKAIKSAPSQVTLYNRNGETAMKIGGNSFYYGPGPTTIHTLDPRTGERRLPKYQDTCDATRVMDALENIDYLMDFGTISDVETEIIDVRTFKAMIDNSPKPILHWAYNRDNTVAMINMGKEVKGSYEELRKHPFFALYSEPITPLIHENEGLDVCMTMAEYGLPSVYTSAAQAGLTSPATLAGTVVIQLAESLSGLVVNQLVREGAPFVMGGVTTVVDMGSMQITYGSPEFCLLTSAVSCMSKFYGLPVFTTGGCTDSKCVDQQAGIDISLNLLMAGLSGGNLIHDIGYMESGLMTSMTNMVIADEVLYEVKRIIRGIEVSENTLALDVIKKVGPGGNFIGAKHTFQNFKKEWFMPNIINRQINSNWTASGSPTLADAANKKLIDILDNYNPEYLDKDISANCDKVIKDLLKKYKK